MTKLHLPTLFFPSVPKLLTRFKLSLEFSYGQGYILYTCAGRAPSGFLTSDMASLPWLKVQTAFPTLVIQYQEPMNVLAEVNYCMLFSASALKMGAAPCIRVPLVAVSRNYLKRLLIPTWPVNEVLVL